MADTTIPQGKPGIASFATESFMNIGEPRFGEKVPTTIHEEVTAGANLDLPLYSVVSVLAGVLALAIFGQAASKALTFSAAGTAADTITIGTTVYTLRAAPTTIANEVKIGGDAAGSAANLAAAINGTGVPGTDYGSLTVPHPDVFATVAGAVVTVTAIVPGDEGNSIALAEAGTGTSWAGGATALSGGDEDADAAPYGILAAPVIMTNGQTMSVPFYREGVWDDRNLNWHASFDTKEKRQNAFKKSLSPGIFIQRGKFSSANIAI